MKQFRIETADSAQLKSLL